MKGLNKYYGIDGVDGSGKDYFIQNIFSNNGYKIIKAGGAGLNKENIFEFSENILKNQYKEIFLNLNQKLVLNRTFISFLVGKIIDNEYYYNKLQYFYEILYEKYNIEGLMYLILTRDVEQIKEVLKEREKKSGLSKYEEKLLTSDTLLPEQQSLFKEIGKKIGATFIYNDGTEKFLLSNKI